MAFEFVLTERPACTAAGVKVATTMQNANVDCMKLWSDDFGPKMSSFPADPAFNGECYGISSDQNMEKGTFTYWAAMPLAPGAAVPAGMETIELPAGMYVACHHLALADIGPAYTEMYEQWLPSQSAYDLDLASPGLELYTHEFEQSGKLSIFCRLIEK